MATRSILSVETDYEDNAGLEAVRCPKCGEATGLHFDTVLFGGAGGVVVQVDSRGEDRGAIPQVSVKSVSNASTAAQRTEEQLSNHRRHYIKIIGWCEHCGQEPFGLLFKQHKGQTYFGFTDDEPEDA